MSDLRFLAEVLSERTDHAWTNNSTIFLELVKEADNELADHGRMASKDMLLNVCGGKLDDDEVITLPSGSRWSSTSERGPWFKIG